MYPYAHIGALQIPMYGMCVLAGLCVGAFVLKVVCRREHIVLPLGEIGILLAIVGLFRARLFHLAESPCQFVQHPWRELLINDGYAWFGAVIGCSVATILLAKWYSMKPMVLFDALSAPVAFGYALGRIGCLLAGDGCYGTPTQLPWGMAFKSGLVSTTVLVHPTPIYEATVSVILGAHILKIATPGSARSFRRYLLLAGVARFCIEFFRGIPRCSLSLVPPNLPVSVVSW